MEKAKQKKQPQNWYQRWKQFPFHTHVNWLIFGALAWPVALVFLGSLQTDLKPVENGPNGQVAGIRTRRLVEPAIEEEAARTGPDERVLGESIAPILTPTELEAMGIKPNHNSINVTDPKVGEVMGEETKVMLTPSELELQGIQRAKNTNK